MTVYVCVTYYQGGESKVEGVCATLEGAQELAELCGSEIEEFEIWDN